MQTRLFLGLFASLTFSSTARAEPWSEQPGFFIENANYGASMVDAADLDGDGWIDLVFANGGGYDKGDDNSDLPQQAFINQAGASMLDMSDQIFGQGTRYNGRVIKVRDIDRDGDNDIMLGVTWQHQSQLLINIGAGNFINTGNIPNDDASIGDLEFGDVDGDGDLDMILADWGPEAPVGDPGVTAGGKTLLWLQLGDPGGFDQPGSGIFGDFTGNMPDTEDDKIRWSWDLEFIDLDNDFHLDAAISCFSCTQNSIWLFANDGSGHFTNITAGNVPQGLGAFDAEPMELNGDDFLDLVTLRDGTSGRNRVLVNDGMGGFSDKSDLIWPKLENPASFDHMAAFLDYNSDGLPDIVTGAFNPGKTYPDRLMENQAGKFKQNTFAFATATPATYALVLADFNQDRILDVAMSQNENAFDKKVFIGSNVDLQPDTAPPVFNNYQKLAADIEFGVDHTLKVRCHDNKSPLMLHDFQDGEGKQNGRPFVESWGVAPADPDNDAGTFSPPGEWYGEYLWRVSFNVPTGQDFVYRICAIDAAGNKSCTPIETILKPEEETSSTTTETTMGAEGTDTEITTMSTQTSLEGTDGLTSTSDSDSDGDADSDSINVPTESFTTGNGDNESNTFSDSGTELDDDGCELVRRSDQGLNDGGCLCNGRSGRLGGFLIPLLALVRRRRRV